MIKVVLDTNVFISGLNFPSSKPAHILQLAVFGIVKNLTSEHILRETNDILNDKFHWEKNQTKAAISWIKIFSKTVRPKKSIRIIPHSPDNRILECATAGKARYIISGDKHLTELKKYKNISILTPQEFLNSLVKIIE